MTLRRGTRRCTGAQEGDMQVRGQQGRGIRPPEHREDTGRTQGGHREDGGRTEGGRREDGGRTQGGPQHREDGGGCEQACQCDKQAWHGYKAGDLLMQSWGSIEGLQPDTHPFLAQGEVGQEAYHAGRVRRRRGAR